MSSRNIRCWHRRVIEKCLPYLAILSVSVSAECLVRKRAHRLMYSDRMCLKKKEESWPCYSIDPSSERSKKYFWGQDPNGKKLSVHPKSFIRPSPFRLAHWAVIMARKTHETIILCEAAGFDKTLSNCEVRVKLRRAFHGRLLPVDSAGHFWAMSCRASSAVSWKWPMVSLSTRPMETM